MGNSATTSVPEGTHEPSEEETPEFKEAGNWFGSGGKAATPACLTAPTEPSTLEGTNETEGDKKKSDFEEFRLRLRTLSWYKFNSSFTKPFLDSLFWEIHQNWNSLYEYNDVINHKSGHNFREYFLHKRLDHPVDGYHFRIKKAKVYFEKEWSGTPPPGIANFYAVKDREALPPGKKWLDLLYMEMRYCTNYSHEGVSFGDNWVYEVNLKFYYHQTPREPTLDSDGHDTTPLLFPNKDFTNIRGYVLDADGHLLLEKDKAKCQEYAASKYAASKDTSTARPHKKTRYQPKQYGWEYKYFLT